jgi:hypothetical protein
MSSPCEDPTCPSCSLHCPNCGADLDILELDPEAGLVRCPRCDLEEALPHPEMIAMRHRQVLAISGRSIPEWKAQARQLHARFHHRWRSTMSYLDPASAALSHADDVMVTTRCDEDVAIVLAQEAYQELQHMICQDPSLAHVRYKDLETPYLDDWY